MRVSDGNPAAVADLADVEQTALKLPVALVTVVVVAVTAVPNVVTGELVAYLATVTAVSTEMAVMTVSVATRVVVMSGTVRVLDTATRLLAKKLQTHQRTFLRSWQTWW